MNFTTPEFFLFLPAVLVGYVFVVHREHARDVFLLVASYLFYMSWNWQYAGLIAFSTIVDYTVGRQLGRTEGPRKRKALLIVSLSVNLGPACSVGHSMSRRFACSCRWASPSTRSRR